MLEIPAVPDATLHSQTDRGGGEESTLRSGQSQTNEGGAV
jgi:hypothetical protein